LLLKQKLRQDFIPDTPKKNHKRNCCCSWNGTKEHTMTVKIGDSVLYGKYAGTELKLEGKTIMRRRYSGNSLFQQEIKKINILQTQKTNQQTNGKRYKI
jgi:hypothetical protein